MIQIEQSFWSPIAFITLKNYRYGTYVSLVPCSSFVTNNTENFNISNFLNQFCYFHERLLKKKILQLWCLSNLVPRSSFVTNNTEKFNSLSFLNYFCYFHERLLKKPRTGLHLLIVNIYVFAGRRRSLWRGSIGSGCTSHLSIILYRILFASFLYGQHVSCALRSTRPVLRWQASIEAPD